MLTATTLLLFDKVTTSDSEIYSLSFTLDLKLNISLYFVPNKKTATYFFRAYMSGSHSSTVTVIPLFHLPDLPYVLEAYLVCIDVIRLENICYDDLSIICLKCTLTCVIHINV